ncbi:PEP-CTERM sorting domain-containing protein [Rhodoferax sp. U11-2br]|uniref:PEP-CTERM sorting domain-containing protein n=1 Tax=Rhodoferax sp. U11-2br TaxID=2838878 RepID=UPI001BE8AE5A|nr:PEP-CTERM sorting domain-containing protein [Rhodoferax sp. U11-2br]MBT3067022.1 PEP-CTERM sorting domain-containing protein [Rhodoferax sp. U11-2br]
MKKSLISLGLAAVLGLASASASASAINVGGVVWDPDSAQSLPSLIDFKSFGSLFETGVNTEQGLTSVTGWGQVERMNSSVNNQSSFVPGGELTFTFTMDLVSLLPNPITGKIDFSFNNLLVNIFIDNTPNYIGDYATSSDGNLWLSLVGKGNLSGEGSNIGTGSDSGSGSALLDVVGGLAAENFDTNSRLNGADFVFSSSFQPAGYQENGRDILSGTFDLTGNSIPEPGSLALLGLGLAGLGLVKRRRMATK